MALQGPGRGPYTWHPSTVVLLCLLIAVACGSVSLLVYHVNQISDLVLQENEYIASLAAKDQTGPASSRQKREPSTLIGSSSYFYQTVETLAAEHADNKRELDVISAKVDGLILAMEKLAADQNDTKQEVAELAQQLAALHNHTSDQPVPIGDGVDIFNLSNLIVDSDDSMENETDTQAELDGTANDTQYAIEWFQLATRHERFKSLTLDQMHEILASDALQAETEQQVYKGLTTWLDAKESRATHLCELLGHVRLSSVELEILRNATIDGDVAQRSTCLATMDHGANSTAGAKPRHKNGSYLVAIGGAPNYRGVEIYNALSDTWSDAAPMPTGKLFHAAAMIETSPVDHIIYTCGGSLSNGRSCLKYDFEANKWHSNVAQMLTARHSFGLGVHDGKLYAAGGMDPSYRILNSLEIYDPTTNAWTQLANMPYHAGRYGFAQVNNEFYYLGGVNSANKWHNATYKYAPATQAWTPLADMPNHISQFPAVAATTLQNESFIYSLGGIVCFGCVEKYSITSNEWRVDPAMKLTAYRSGHSAGILDGSIFVAGGNDHLTSVERINPHSDSKWTSMESMNDGRQSFALVPITTGYTFKFNRNYW